MPYRSCAFVVRALRNEETEVALDDGAKWLRKSAKVQAILTSVSRVTRTGNETDIPDIFRHFFLNAIAAH